jgi:acyl-CoA oxidase
VIQECREACGGHGYLKSSRFSELRDNNDPLLTFEGDNNVLLQQTSNFLLSAYEEYLKNKSIPTTPLMSIHFLNNFDDIMKQKFNNDSDLLNYKSKNFNLS